MWVIVGHRRGNLIVEEWMREGSNLELEVRVHHSYRELERCPVGVLERRIDEGS